MWAWKHFHHCTKLTRVWVKLSSGLTAKPWSFSNTKTFGSRLLGILMPMALTVLRLQLSVFHNYILPPTAVIKAPFQVFLLSSTIFDLPNISSITSEYHTVTDFFVLLTPWSPLSPKFCQDCVTLLKSESRRFIPGIWQFEKWWLFVKIKRGKVLCAHQISGKSPWNGGGHWLEPLGAVPGPISPPSRKCPMLIPPWFPAY